MKFLESKIPPHRDSQLALPDCGCWFFENDVHGEAAWGERWCFKQWREQQQYSLLTIVFLRYITMVNWPRLSSLPWLQFSSYCGCSAVNTISKYEVLPLANVPLVSSGTVLWGHQAFILVGLRSHAGVFCLRVYIWFLDPGMSFKGNTS